MRFSRSQRRFFRAGFVLLTGLFAISADAAVLESKHITISSQDNLTRVRILLDAAVDIRVVDAMDSNSCYFVDIYFTRAAFADSVFHVRDGILKAWQTRSYPGNNVLRIIFFPVAKTAFQVSDENTGALFPPATLADTRFVPSGQKTSALIIDTFNPRVPRRESTSQKLVILDPGHGGSDPGAVFSLGGRNQLLEKDITLAVALEVRRLLNRSDIARAVLTRESDIRMGLRARRDFAERLQGDLFVSIHTNAAKYHRRTNTARGIEFYYLGRASHPDTSALVEGENRDSGAPLDSVSSAQLDRIMKQIARDFLDDSRVSSAYVCEWFDHVFRKDAYFNVYNRGIKSAPFQVLMNRAMPAVLVEIGFIDHPTEGRYLADPAFQKRVARLMAEAILQYLAAVDARGSLPQAVPGKGR